MTRKIDLIMNAINTRGDADEEVRGILERTAKMKPSYASLILVDFVKFAAAVDTVRDSRASIMRYCTSLRQVVTSPECPPQARRLMDAIVGALLAWHSGDDLAHTMAGVTFRKAFFCCGSDIPAYTASSFFSSSALKVMKRKAAESEDADCPNRFILELLSSPQSEQQLRTEVLRAACACVEASDSSRSLGFESLFKKGSAHDDVWQTVGARLYGEEDPEVVRWTAVVSDLTGDCDRVRALIAILSFLLYYQYLRKHATETIAKFGEDAEPSKAEEEEKRVEATHSRPAADIEAWATANPGKIRVVKTD
ncbi:hypothetical protein JKP88DRAFT_273624 [Tribonema minus]|uniref:Uncharacterized protein n=1 Tax=Tribonema minus TaxID=303371 RepID=A0A835YRF3_9STRA|nr:hypothetical protein JKP88DRAFT_273624 [Tribonema minus]